MNFNVTSRLLPSVPSLLVREALSEMKTQYYPYVRQLYIPQPTPGSVWLRGEEGGGGGEKFELKTVCADIEVSCQQKCDVVMSSRCVKATC